jgi:xanthine/uracil/vitamin C permease (AzgA family)
MVMAYVIFVNPIVLGYSSVPGLEGKGLNAVVAFELVAGRGLTWPQAMTVVRVLG